MNKKAVVFDIDGVLADFEQKLVNVLVSEFGGIGSLNRHMFSLEERFKHHSKVLQRATQYVNEPNFYRNLGRIDGGCNLATDFWGKRTLVDTKVEVKY